MSAVTRVFTSNRTQAVRLPKDVAFPATVRDVRVFRSGQKRVLVPANAVWDDFFDQPGTDFPADRDQPAPQDREPL
jgi:antitoxin VapB